MTRSKSLWLVSALALTSCMSASTELAAGPMEDRRSEILSVLERLDDRSLTTEEQLKNYLSDAVILPPGEAEIRGREAIRDHLNGFGTGVDLIARHEIVELDFAGETALVQGRVIGTASPDGDPNTYAFETKNLIVMEPDAAGALKISKVIYNSAPTAPVEPAMTTAETDPVPNLNVFSKFAGTWTLKEDLFQQVWDGETVETLTIENHLTTCDRVNTDKSALCVVDAGDFEGHIFWAQNEETSTFHHVSHFGERRLGVGEGQMSDTGDLNIKITFSDEPTGTYRIYDYIWIDDDTYEMISRQYRADGTATGNWYGGTFVRVETSD
ncbi:MAG: nuclear transport factor 2 family protein [Henriciella sp.]|nr:nuclear transport factor 2 family protein [Henriciella sp.]